MSQLLLKQIHQDGKMKSWILRDEGRKYTFGLSKFCDINSIDESHEDVMGFFERNQGEWYFVDLSKKSIKLTTSRHRIVDGFELPIGNTKLAFHVFHEKEKLLSRIQGMKLEDPTSKTKSSTKKLLVIVSHGLILETRIVDRDYQAKDIDEDVEVIEREVVLVEDEHIRKRKLFSEIDSDSVKIFSGSFLAGLLLIGFTFLFDSPPALEHPVDVPRTANAPIIIKSPKDLQAVKKKEPDKQNVAAMKDPKKTKTSTQGGGSKSTRTSITQGRISQLIGKISATSARSKNIVVTTGVAAGSQPSGRALAAIGKADRGGQDWGTENKNGAVTVSTAGMGGKKSLQNSLKEGSTGKAGINLIEDEVEVGGGLDRDVIAQYIKSQLGHILYCYERQLSATPNLFGKVAVRFTIGGDGQVMTQKIGDTTLKSGVVEGCILSRIAKWKFPAPKGGTQVIVTYPFLFKSTN